MFRDAQVHALVDLAHPAGRPFGIGESHAVLPVPVSDDHDTGLRQQRRYDIRLVTRKHETSAVEPQGPHQFDAGLQFPLNDVG